MARPRTRHNTGRAFTNDSGTPVPTPAVSCALTFASAPASIPGPPERYMDKDLQRAIRLAQKSFIKG